MVSDPFCYSNAEKQEKFVAPVRPRYASYDQLMWSITSSPNTFGKRETAIYY